MSGWPVLDPAEHERGEDARALERLVASPQAYGEVNEVKAVIDGVHDAQNQPLSSRRTDGRA